MANIFTTDTLPNQLREQAAGGKLGEVNITKDTMEPSKIFKSDCKIYGKVKARKHRSLYA